MDLIPAAFSTEVPTFATREEYCVFVRQWRRFYGYIRMLHTIRKLSARQAACTTEAKQEHYAKMIEHARAGYDKAVAADRIAVPAKEELAAWLKTVPAGGWLVTPENTWNPRTKPHRIPRYWGSDSEGHFQALVVWLLWLRRATKEANRGLFTLPAKAA